MLSTGQARIGATCDLFLNKGECVQQSLIEGSDLGFIPPEEMLLQSASAAIIQPPESRVGRVAQQAIVPASFKSTCH